MSSTIAEESAEFTAFVRNIPSDYTNDQLQDLFEDIGPLRRAFLITRSQTPAPQKATETEDNEQKESKQFGFAVFATEADRDAAIEQLNGTEVDGQKIMVEKAVKKGEKAPKKGTKRKADKPLEKAPKPKKLKQKKTISVGESRCVLVQNLPKKLERETFEKCVKHVGKFDVIIFPAPESTEHFLAARVVFHTPSAALKSVKRLASGRNRAHLGTKCAVRVMRAASRLGRLIIRNLPFRCSENDLREVFEKFGELKEASIPRKLGDSASNRGFGFVEYKVLAHAASAIAAVNGTKIGQRRVAVDWAMSKHHFEIYSNALTPVLPKDKKLSKKQKLKIEKREKLQKAKTEKSSAAGGEPSVVSKEPSVVSKEHSVVAKEPSVVSEEPSEVSEEHSDVSEEPSEVSEEHSEVSEEPSVVSEEPSDDTKIDDDDNMSTERDSEQPSPSPPVRPTRVSDASEGRTLFVRNISTDSTEQRVFERFKEFGRIEYVRLTKDRVTNQSRGSAFVKFASKKSADIALRKSSEIEVGERKKRKRALISDALTASGITLDGRPLVVCLALPAGRMKEVVENRDKQKDRRNIYLAREGLILEESEAAKGLSTADLDIRKKAWRQKKQKLDNPNFSVSRTRLAVRNLPADTDEKALRRACIVEARAGRKRAREDEEGTMFEDKNPKIVQAKIVRDPKRTGKDGQARSLRFGFVEFREHADALTALRALNNAPAPFGTKGARLQVEFALDDARKLLQRKRRLDFRKQKIERIQAEKQSEFGQTEEPPAKRQKLTRGQRRLKKAVEKASRAGLEKNGKVSQAGLEKNGKAAGKSESGKGETADLPAPDRSGLSKKEKRKLRKKARKETTKQRKAEKRERKQKNKVQSHPKETKAAVPTPAAAATKAPAATKRSQPEVSQRRPSMSKRARRELKAEKPFDEMVAAYKKRIFGEKDGNLTEKRR
eukprot:790985_1